MRHYVLIRSAYGPGWSLEANRRRLAMTRAVTIRSLRSQTSRDFTVVVLVHARDDLLGERMAAFDGARFIETDLEGTPSDVAWAGYRADWASAIGPRDEVIATTRLDDDDGFAPWAMERVEAMAARATGRVALMFPLGVRVCGGRYTLVRHESNAMHTLVTQPGDEMTVYDYGHRNVRKVAHVRRIDPRPAWLWSRHDDAISGWRMAERPIVDDIRSMFDVDWSIFGQASGNRMSGGRVFR